VSDFLFNLRLEFVRRPLELIHVLPDLARDLRQLLGPEDHQRQNEQEDRLGKAHSFIILPEPDKQQSQRDTEETTFLADFPRKHVPLMMFADAALVCAG